LAAFGRPVARRASSASTGKVSSGSFWGATKAPGGDAGQVVFSGVLVAFDLEERRAVVIEPVRREWML
jgi:hypothetical protein